MPRSKSQEDSRVGINMYDQWGRPWHATQEKETMTPTGPVMPQFSAPVVPDMKYLKFFGKANPIKVEVNLQALEQDLQEAHEHRERQIRTFTTKYFPGWKNKNPPREVLDKVDGEGPPPMPLEVVWAMMQGNRWVLGFSPNRPAWSYEGAVGAFFNPPQKESLRRKMESSFPDAPEDTGTEAVPLVDADVAPVNPHTLQGVPEGVPVGVGGEHQSWGNIDDFAISQPMTSVRNPGARKE